MNYLEIVFFVISSWLQHMNLNDVLKFEKKKKVWPQLKKYKTNTSSLTTENLENEKTKSNL